MVTLAQLSSVSEVGSIGGHSQTRLLGKSFHDRPSCIISSQPVWHECARCRLGPCSAHLQHCDDEVQDQLLPLLEAGMQVVLAMGHLPHQGLVSERVGLPSTVEC